MRRALAAAGFDYDALVHREAALPVPVVSRPGSRVRLRPSPRDRCARRQRDSGVISGLMKTLLSIDRFVGRGCAGPNRNEPGQMAEAPCPPVDRCAG